MSHVDFKKWPFCPVKYKGQEPQVLTQDVEVLAILKGGGGGAQRVPPLKMEGGGGSAQEVSDK